MASIPFDETNYLTPTTITTNLLKIFKKQLTSFQEKKSSGKVIVDKVIINL
jgi:hypothetical protein